jgi:hypothetical protein
MGYYISIIQDKLKCKRDINEELGGLNKKNKLFLPWYWSENYVKTDDTCFKWTDNFVDDLFILQSLGVRGRLVTHGEEDDYYKYVVDGNTIKEYYGRIVFPKDRYQILKGNPKLKRQKL